MLFMLTPEIKTNLILKEIGIKRYSYRTNQPKSKEKNFNYFQKGLILTLLDKPFENFVDEQQNLIRAIVSSTKLDNGDEYFTSFCFQSKKDLKDKISNSLNIELTIIFGTELEGIGISKEIIAPSINQLVNSNDLKKNLWKEIKENLNI